ncbi:MAG: hypothetical protein P4L84_35045 [Isosphaeraceae bacterium]|nr:hypothetical protein [Isosphaeraceae bacterium]
MGIIAAKNVIAGSGTGDPLRNPGAPVAGADEVQTITGAATGGTGALTFNGQSTAALAATASAATIQAALVGLSSIGAGNVVCAGGPLGTAGVTVTFQGALANAPQSLITVGAGFTGGAVTVAETTPGTTATFAGIAAVGALMIDTTNAILYQNTGTQAAPVWTKVGTET